MPFVLGDVDLLSTGDLPDKPLVVIVSEVGAWILFPSFPLTAKI
jgi:hypothetical protein